MAQPYTDGSNSRLQCVCTFQGISFLDAGFIGFACLGYLLRAREDATRIQEDTYDWQCRSNANIMCRMGEAAEGMFREALDYFEAVSETQTSYPQGGSYLPNGALHEQALFAKWREKQRY